MTWNGHGWGALVTEGNALYLREFTPDGEALDARRRVPFDVEEDAEVSLVRGYFVAVAPRSRHDARVLRLNADGELPSAPSALDETVSDDLSLMARPGVTMAPAAMVYTTTNGTKLRAIRPDGRLDVPFECPADVEPRDVVVVGDGFRALAVPSDPATGDTTGVDVVAFDASCRVQWRTQLWRGPVNGRVQAIAQSDERLFVGFDDRDGTAWVAALDDDGDVVIRPRPFVRNAGSPRLVARSRGATFIVVRMDETADRIDAYRLDRHGIHQDAYTVVSAPSVRLSFVAPDPWGGALVGWERPGSTGVSRVAPPQFHYLARVCP